MRNSLCHFATGAENGVQVAVRQLEVQISDIDGRF